MSGSTVTASRGSLIVALNPAATLLGEALELSMLAGGALVVGGIWLINRPQRASAAPVAAAG